MDMNIFVRTNCTLVPDRPKLHGICCASQPLTRQLHQESQPLGNVSLFITITTKIGNSVGKFSGHSLEVRWGIWSESTHSNTKM